jgi:hypothetical protein
MYVYLIGHQGPTGLMTQSYGPKNTGLISRRRVESEGSFVAGATVFGKIIN